METLKIVCNKHNQCVADAVEKLQRNAEIIDVVMICDGHYFFLHKLVLAASSTFFEVSILSLTLLLRLSLIVILIQSILKDVPTTKSPQLIHLVDYPLEDARLLVEVMSNLLFLFICLLKIFVHGFFSAHVQRTNNGHKFST